jgi:hypothetical protein
MYSIGNRYHVEVERTHPNKIIVYAKYMGENYLSQSVAAEKNVRSEKTKVVKDKIKNIYRKRLFK